MDDTIVEGPHAVASRIFAHSRVAKWPWVASSMRLQGNLTDLRGLAPALELDVDVLWRSWKSILQVRLGRAGLRNKRVNTKRCLGVVYSMSHPPPDLTLDLALAFEHDAEPQAIEDQVVGDEGVLPLVLEPTVVPAQGLTRSSQGVRLLRQFLSASLQVGAVVSLPTMLEDGEPTALIVQVLHVEVRNKLVETYVGEGEMPELYSISAQVWEQWRPTSSSPIELGESIDCFMYGEPCKLDILRLIGTDPSARTQMQKWSVRESDVEGCMCFHSPERLQPTAALQDASTPVLCLMDALAAGSWVGESRLVTHTPQSGLAFDNRNLAGRRPYLQSVLASSDLFGKGVACFRSDNPLSFYLLLLKVQRDIPEGRPAAWYREVLRKSASSPTESLESLLALPPAPQGALQRLPRPPAPIADAAGSSDDEVVGGGSPAGYVEALSAGVPEQDVVVAAHAAPGELCAAEAAGVDADAPPYPPVIEGSPVRLVKGRQDLRWSYRDRLSVPCNNPDHRAHGCAKTRSLDLDQHIYGPRAAHFFLGAWLRLSNLPVAEHRKRRPTVAEIKLYAESFSD